MDCLPTRKEGLRSDPGAAAVNRRRTPAPRFAREFRMIGLIVVNKYPSAAV